METGAITEYIDVAQLVLYLFWIFFAGLIIYLHRENKREGYPLDSEISDRVTVVGFPAPPPPKTFLMPDGSTRTVPREEVPRSLNAKPMGPWAGTPLVPLGDPMVDGVGPASYSQRADHPDHTWDGRVMIVPLRTEPSMTLSPKDPDPRGLAVVGTDGESGGMVTDVWIDRADHLMRYFEIDVADADGSKRVLMPYNFGHIDTRTKQLKVSAILGSQFSKAPVTAHPEQVTLLEEDRICAFYAGGLLYATPERSEPLI